MNKNRVYKFGGTSVRDATRIRRVTKLITASNQPLVVVTSAAAGVTDTLASLGTVNAEATRSSLRDRHHQIIEELNIERSQAENIRTHISTLLNRVNTPSNNREHAFLMAMGERMMGPILAASLNQEGCKAQFVDGCGLIHTDNHWLAAQVDFEKTRRAVQASLPQLLDQGIVPIVPGFVGGNPDGHTTTLGRNGSDYSASILGFCLDADEVWIWTDVDGIYTADPRHHRHARLLREISFRESAEAAYFGAKVIHPYTMWPLLDTDTSIRIKNTGRPEQEGTLICRQPKNRGAHLLTTAIKDVAVITVGGYGMVGVPGVAQKVFTAISECKTNVLMISQSSSEHNISLVIKQDDVERTLASLNHALHVWMKEQHRVDRIKVLDHVAILSVVGENMRGRSGIAGTIFSALGSAGINVIAIAQGSSEYSISIVISADDLHRAIDECVSGTSARFDQG